MQYTAAAAISSSAGPGPRLISEPVWRLPLVGCARLSSGLPHWSTLVPTSTSLRIALLAPPMEPVPPLAYAGTERVVATLAEELTARGHHVTLFASGDSTAPGELVPVTPRSLWSTGYRGDVSAFVMLTIAKAWEQADR